MTRVLLVILLAALQNTAGSALDVSRITVSEPTRICELDLDVLKGALRRLSWSPDAQHIHVQTFDDRDRALHDFLVDLYNGEVSLAYGEPEWAAQYWEMKSSQSAPGVPLLRLEMTRVERRMTATPAIPAASPGGQYVPEPRNAVEAGEADFTLRLLGEPIGTWMNAPPHLGEVFGWGPPGSAALAFVDRDGRLRLIDRAKHTQAVAGVKGATLPAWSLDGGRLAWVQKSGRRKYALLSATIARN